MSREKSKSITVKEVPAGAAPISGETSVTPGQRYQMIAEAAYFRAEKRGFVEGDVAQDWLDAEAEIDNYFVNEQIPNHNEAEE